MGYSTCDLQTDLRRHLEATGYTFNCSDGDTLGIPGVVTGHWRWKFGSEVGDEMDSETAAEADAVEHFFNRAAAMNKAVQAIVQVDRASSSELEEAMQALAALVNGSADQNGSERAAEGTDRPRGG